MKKLKLLIRTICTFGIIALLLFSINLTVAVSPAQNAPLTIAPEAPQHSHAGHTHSQAAPSGVIVPNAVTNVNIQNFAFTPAVITVTVGTTVTWTNIDASDHTVTSDTSLFDSGNLAQNATFSFTFNQVGSFAYHCAIHPGMTGRVDVVPPLAETALYPKAVVANDPSFTLTIDGTGFATGAIVKWTNPPQPDLTPISLTSTRIQVTVPATYITAVGTPDITVVNPLPSGSSNSLPLAINAQCDPLVVTKKTDDGSCGTLRNALAPPAPGVTDVTISLSIVPPDIITLTNGLTLTLGVTTTINGPCGPTGPGLTINGNGAPGNGILVNGRALINGLKVIGFVGRQIFLPNGKDSTFTCFVARRT